MYNFFSNPLSRIVFDKYACNVVAGQMIVVQQKMAKSDSVAACSLSMFLFYLES